MDLRKIRRSCFLTQSELAKKLNVSCETISCWERGTRNPSLENLKTLSQFCKENGIDFSI